MAVERWIFCNANFEDPDLQEYQIRLCDGGLQTPACKDRLIELSNRLMSVTHRRDSLRTQRSWFAGYLTPELYVVALGGEQNSLMNTNFSKSRGLYCALALAFTGSDIRLYKKDEGLFAPLKKLLLEINQTGRCPSDGLSGAALAAACRDYEETPLRDSIPQKTGSLVRSDPETDNALWRQSLSRPAMTGLLSSEDAQLLLEDYPGGIASVAGNAPLQFTSQDAGSKKWKQEIEEAKAREAEQEQHTKSLLAETERVKQEREARKAQFEREQAAARRARIWLTVGGLCAIGAVFFLILGGRG